MKKVITLILSAILVVSVIAGCGVHKLSSAETSITVSDSTLETTPKSFEELYGSQLPRYMDYQYYFDGKPVMTQESNFYFINAFFDLSSAGPTTSLGYIDLSASFSGEEYNTYGDYFIYYVENSIQMTCILCQRAESEGVVLSDEKKQSIDDMMNEIKSTTAPAAGLSIKEYLEIHYGPGMDEESFRKVIERYYLVDAYAQYYCSKPEFMAAIEGTKEVALSSATAMKNQCKTIDDLTGLAEEGRANGTVRDQGDIDVPKGQVVPKFEEWAYGEDRKEGEMDIIYAPEYGYFIVGYLGINPETDVPKVRYALFSAPETNQSALEQMYDEVLQEISTKKHDFYKTKKSTSPVATDVLLVVFVTLAGVAVVLIIDMLIHNTINKNSKNLKNGKKKK